MSEHHIDPRETRHRIDVRSSWVRQMTRNELLDFAEQLFEECAEVMEGKNKGYSGRSDDPFANFRLYEKIGITVPQGIFTRFTDKFSRLSGLLQHLGDHKNYDDLDEPIEDTIKDAINYLVLLLAFLQQETHQCTKQQPPQDTTNTTPREGT